MYEIITGEHPFKNINKDARKTLLEIKEFNYPDTMSPQAKHLISKFCCPKME